MKFNKQEWIGNWENFENYIYSENDNIVRAWSLADEAGKQMPMFKNGVKAFWKQACATVNAENSVTINGWKIVASDNGILVTWLDSQHNILFEDNYELISVLDKGLENKPNFVFRSCSDNCSPFKYVLAMEPMPERDAKDNGGLISHLHYQFASFLDKLINDDKLVNPYWYPTMCDKECTVLDKCNIILAMHRLPLWKETDLNK